MTENLDRKIDNAIKLLQTAARTDDDIELCYSGGKDSDAILD